MRGIDGRVARHLVKHVMVFGVVVMAAGGALLGTAVAASAAAPSISFTQTAPILPSSNLSTTIIGSGFHHSSIGALFECSTVAGQPTVDVSTTTGLKSADLGKLPVSCGDETSVVTTSKGDLPPWAIIGLEEGALGPSGTGTDSTGGDAATDATNYPCPPTSAQASAGCVVMYVDAAGDSATAPITFGTPPTTTTGPTSCTGQPKSDTATNATTGVSATLTVTPATCLVGGEVVQVTGTGLATGEGTLLECNSDSSQPTLSLAGNTVPISCTSLDVVSAVSGGLSAKAGAFTIQTGTTGPPIAGNDSTGGNAATDAASYPCPPTPAQVTAGDTCEIVFRDGGGDDLVVPISFNPGGAGASPSKTKASSAQTSSTKAKASTVATAAASGSLAFTGPGPSLWIVGLVGMALILIGSCLLLVVEVPRRTLTVLASRLPRRSAEDA